MKRKIIFLFLLPLFHVLLYSACCGEPELYFFDLEQLQVGTGYREGQLAVDSVVTADTLVLLFKGDYSLVASQWNWRGFSPVLLSHATSCDNGLRGLKYPVQDINVYATEAYFNQGAIRENLDAIVLYQYYSRPSDPEYTKQEYLAYLNRPNTGRDHRAPLVEGTIRLTQKSKLSDTHSFIVEVIEANGDTTIAQTRSLVWK